MGDNKYNAGRVQCLQNETRIAIMKALSPTAVNTSKNVHVTNDLTIPWQLNPQCSLFLELSRDLLALTLNLESSSKMDLAGTQLTDRTSYHVTREFAQRLSVSDDGRGLSAQFPGAKGPVDVADICIYAELRTFCEFS